MCVVVKVVELVLKMIKIMIVVVRVKMVCGILMIFLVLMFNIIML